MAVVLSTVPQGNVTQALSVIANNFALLQASFNQLIAQTSPGAQTTTQGFIVPGVVTNYAGNPTAGNGVLTVVAYTRLTNLIAGSAALMPLCSVGAAGGSYLVTSTVTVVSGTSFGIQTGIVYTNDIGSSATVKLQYDATGPLWTGSTGISNTLTAGGIGTYCAAPAHIRAYPNTTIGYLLSGGFSSVVYNVEIAVLRLA